MLSLTGMGTLSSSFDSSIFSSCIRVRVRERSDVQYISYREFFLDSYCTLHSKKQSIRSTLRECLSLLQNGLTELYMQMEYTQNHSYTKLLWLKLCTMC